MGMGGGGSVSIPQRDWSSEWPNIKQGYGGQIGQYNQFIGKDPLLSAAYPFALNQLNNVGDLTGPLQDTLSNMPGPEGYANELNRYSTQLGRLQGPLGAQVQNLRNLQTRQLNEVIGSGGRLNEEQQRIADQAALGLASGAGMGNSNAGIAQALLNRDQYRQQRFNTAVDQSLGVSQGIGGLTGIEGQLVGQRAGLTQAKQGIYSNDALTRLGLTQGIQGIGTQALQNVLGTEQTGVKSFSELTNPILAYMSDLFSSNQNAAAAQSIAGANQSAGKTSGTLGAIGSIAGAVGTAY